jgi:membrane-bound lytic murein transglycosylase D
VTLSIKLMILFAVLSLSACAHTPTTLMRTHQSELAIENIYQQVSAAIIIGDEGLSNYRKGDNDRAMKLLTKAREALNLTAAQCMRLNGCDMERVWGAQNTLLARQAETMLGREFDNTSVEESLPIEEKNEESQSPIMQTMPETARTAALLKGQDLRQLITLNEPIRAAMEEWLTWMRPTLLEAYENYQYMRYKMWPEYEKSELPEALLFGILAKESGGKVHAVSHAGASGPLQFMYHTGARYGLGQEQGFDMRFDATAATRANVAYLNDHLKIFNNNLELVLGAYNGGEGRMQRLFAKGGKSFWDPSVFYQLPPETRDYVPMVLGAAWLFLHADEYNLKLPSIDTRPGELELTHTASLNELSICLGQHGNARGWFRTLRNLNPRYDPSVRLAVGTKLEMPVMAVQAYAEWCMPGPLVRLSQELSAARKPSEIKNQNVASLPSARTHFVRRGETLSSIVRRLGCSTTRSIATANRLSPPRYAIRAGQKLIVPGCRA